MANPNAVVARVPAKVMLAGEYVVLAGARALAVTLDSWLTARLTAANESGIWVHSNLWPTAQHINVTGDLHELRGTPLLHAVAEAAKFYGIDRAELSIDSTIDVSHGIGSSSALRLAVTMVMAYAQETKLTGVMTQKPPSTAGATHTCPYVDAPWGAARFAVALQREAQGSASGYDVATQFRGGLVAFTGCDDLQKWPRTVEQFSPTQLAALGKLVHVYVGGSGAPTAPLLKTTRAWLAAQGHWERLVERSQELVHGLIEALKPTAQDVDRKRLYHACAAHRALLRASPSFPRAIESALLAVRGLDESFTWKTTGAGGDDAILLIGPASELQRARAALKALGRSPLDCMFTAHGAEATVQPSVPTKPALAGMTPERSIQP